MITDKISNILIRLTLVLGMVACGDGNDGGGNGEGRKPQTNEQVIDHAGSGGKDENGQQGSLKVTDCETQWQQKRAERPVGTVMAYRTNETLTNDGIVAEKVRTESRDEVTTVTDTEIVIKTRWEYFEPALGVVDGETRITKETFMLVCVPEYGEAKPDPEGLARAGITILEDRDESIAVVAGTFQTHYEKIRVVNDFGLADEVLGNHWTLKANPNIVVREDTTVTSTIEGVTSVRVTQRELIELKLPQR
jgi:hypothetical protein